MSARATLGRALAVVVSLALVVTLVRVVGAGPTLAALARVGRWMPALLLLEAGVVALNGRALLVLYAAAGGHPPARAFWRATYLGNVLAVALPLGRLIAEGWKAAQLARYTGAAVAAAGAVGLQAAVLLGNAAIALLTLAGVALRCGRTWPTLAMGVFAVAMTVVGLAVALAGRARLGRWLGARFAFAREQGAAFDARFVDASRALPQATAYELAARLLQLAQVAVLLRALGRGVTAVGALAVHGLVLTGAAAGDMLPAQIGASDALLTTAAQRVDLPVPDAFALTLGIHGAQVGLALLAGAVVLMIPAEVVA